MIDPEIEATKLRAKQFRTALENCGRSILPKTFQEFPMGACGDASLLLARFLQYSGLGVFDYVSGESHKTDEHGFQSHAWLRKGNLIVDITADQFNEIREPVLVTRNSRWHKHFEFQTVHIADLEIYDECTKITLLAAYDKITSHITNA